MGPTRRLRIVGRIAARETRGMTSAVWIFLGGGLGAVSRWLLSEAVQAMATHGAIARFPVGIAACNLLGCFLIGAVFGTLTGRQTSGWLCPFLVTGFLGGFTTFSTFGYDSRQLFVDGLGGLALVNLLVSTLGGVALVFLGFRLGHALSG